MRGLPGVGVVVTGRMEMVLLTNGLEKWRCKACGGMYDYGSTKVRNHACKARPKGSKV